MHVRAGAVVGRVWSPCTGAFNVTLGGVAYFAGQQPWFNEAGTMVSPADGSLKLSGVQSGAGTDGYGAYVRLLGRFGLGLAL